MRTSCETFPQAEPKRSKCLNTSLIFAYSFQRDIIVSILLSAPTVEYIYAYIASLGHNLSCFGYSSTWVEDRIKNHIKFTCKKSSKVRCAVVLQQKRAIAQENHFSKNFLDIKSKDMMHLFNIVCTNA